MATVLAVAVMGVGSVFAAGALRTASADVDQPQQKIYLDPQTGEVLEAPSADRIETQSEGQGASQRTRPAEPEAWTNDDGDEMLTPAPDAAPAMRAVRCEDGTLRMGHAESAPSQSEREALCARAKH